MIELDVNGMTCGQCVAAVTRAVKGLDAQADVSVDLNSKRVTVRGVPSAGDVIRVLGDAGFPAVRASAAEPAPAARSGCCCSSRAACR